MDTRDHEHFMRLALEEARKGWGTTHPNPMVGCVIVHDGEVIAASFHEKAGEAHAERRALQQLGRKPDPDSTLYVTLEPCSTIGRTPPCTDAILQSGIKKVVIGATDSNPVNCGRGVTLLRDAGVEVMAGILEKECQDLNLIFNHWITWKNPLIAAKVATTLDGKVATRTGHSQWITSAEARRNVQVWRRLFPAIAVGSGTILADNPKLTSRRPDDTWCPIRFVFDRSLRTADESADLPGVYTDEFRTRTIVVTSPDSPRELRKRLKKAGIRLWKIEPQPSDRFWEIFQEKCRKKDIIGVLFEGGATLLSDLLKHHLIDYLFAYRAPRILGDNEAKSVFFGQSPDGIDDGIALVGVEHENFGPDQMMRGFFRYPRG